VDEACPELDPPLVEELADALAAEVADVAAELAEVAEVEVELADVAVLEEPPAPELVHNTVGRINKTTRK